MKTIKTIIAIAFTGLAACGGAQKTGGGASGGGGGSSDIAAPPGSEKIEPIKPKIEVSADARSDFDKASAFFAENEKSGWSQSACMQSAENFRAVASEHKDLADAQFMVGLSFHKCDMIKDADNAYQATLRANPNHPQSLSNLGEIAFRAGKVDSAKQYWTRAVQAFQKVSAARIGLAQLIIEDMRKTTDNARWAQLDKEAQNHLSSVLAVDNDNIKAYTLYAMLYMEGRRKNKNRLDLAKLLMDEGEKIKADYAPLKNARGLLFYYRNNLGQALKQFQAAAELDPKLVEAHANVAMTTLGFRNYTVAKAEFEKVLELEPKSYDAVIGLGVALRGLGDLKGAEQKYMDAKRLDNSRGEAAFNLGVLYKDFIATNEAELEGSVKQWQVARSHFQDFLSKSTISQDDKDEAKNNIEDCDKLVKQVADFRRMEAEQKAKMDKQQAEFDKQQAEFDRQQKEQEARDKTNQPPGPSPAPTPTPNK